MQTSKEQREELRSLHAAAMAYEENACGAAMNKRAFNQAAQNSMPAILSDLESAEWWRATLQLIATPEVCPTLKTAQAIAQAALEGKTNG